VPQDTTQCESERKSGENRSAGVDGNRTHSLNSIKNNALAINNNRSGAKSGALATDDAQIRWLVEHWNSLPESTRDEIVRLAKATDVSREGPEHLK
jgi:hypothetical protein